MTLSIQFMTKLLSEYCKICNFLRVGQVVCTIHESIFLFPFFLIVNKSCYLLICEQHEFLNKLVGIFANFWNYCQRFTSFIQLKFYFCSFEINRALFEPFFAKFMCQ